MTYKFILSLDPSGNFTEGKGTTGWCLFNTSDNKVIKAGSISALDFECKEDYWNYHLKHINKMKKDHKSLIVVMEDYLLYASKANDQINSRMETPKLIGIIQLHCHSQNIPVFMQKASEVKTRWTNAILHHKEYITEYKRGYVIPNNKEKIDRHCLDSIRHAVHYSNFRNKEDK